MSSVDSHNSTSLAPQEDMKRRKREAALIIIIIAVVALLTFVENRIINFGADFPVSNTILMFILININLLLLILLIFLVFRNLVKLLYARKRRIMGAKLRTRLVVAFIALTLLPTIVLFFFSINFITSSLEFWFNVPVEHALENSLSVGGSIYKRAEENNQIFMGAKEIVQAVKAALDQDPDCELLTPIDKLLRARTTPAHRLIEIFNDERSIEKTLQKTYTDFTG